MNHRTKALDRVLVLSLEQAVAAPYCSSRLADAGARVIKIERAEGDFARGYDSVVKGESAYFVWLNRGKESLVANIKDPDDLALLQRIVSRADVFIQNLAPGAAERAGLGSAELRARYPSLITCDISGYGQTGPYARMKAYDLLVQAESGLCSLTGGRNEMGRVGVSACDIACGMYAYMAVLEALYHRQQTGEGASIACSLFESMADWMAVPLLHFDYAGKTPLRLGLKHPSIHPYGAYTTKGGPPILISIQNEREFAQFCAEVLERPDLSKDDRFNNNVVRCEHAAELDAIINARFCAFERSELLSRLRSARIAFGEVNEVAGLAKHPALRRAPVCTPSGEVELPAPPASVAEREVALGAVPALGQHSRSIREEFGSGA